VSPLTATHATYVVTYVGESLESRVERSISDNGWRGQSHADVGPVAQCMVERRSLIGELSLVCTGPAADG